MFVYYPNSEPCSVWLPGNWMGNVFCYFFRIHFHEIIMMAERNEWQKEKGARWTTNYGIWRKYYRGRQVKLGESGFVIVLLVGTCN